MFGICKKENEEEMKELRAKISDAARTVKEEEEEPVLEYGLRRVFSRFETLLEADAARKRPLLSSQERAPVRKVLKEFSEQERRSGRVFLILLFGMVSLTVWGYYSWPAKWRLGLPERSSPERKDDFSEFHKWDEDVE